LITEGQIIEKATNSLNLLLTKGSFYYTSHLGIYTLTDSKFADTLNKAGFKITNRKDGIITLSDENPQKEVPGWAPGNYWNFHNSEEKRDALNLELRLIPQMNYKERGIVFFPHVWGGYLSSIDILPSFRIFKVVAEYDKNANQFIKEIARNEKLVVPFKDIKLAGIRHIKTLFNEFMCGNDSIERLAHSTISPFNPNPYSFEITFKTEILYVPEDIQPLVFQAWQVQLTNFIREFGL
jgi:hypothetical protein